MVPVQFPSTVQNAVLTAEERSQSGGVVILSGMKMKEELNQL
jgi:hypothetical protein